MGFAASCTEILDWCSHEHVSLKIAYTRTHACSLIHIHIHTNTHNTYTQRHTWSTRAMSDASNNTADIDEDHHHAENDRRDQGRGEVLYPWFASQAIRQVYTRHMTTTQPCNGYKSCGGCAGCCTCRVDVLLDTGSNEPLGIINYAILWARCITTPVRSCAPRMLARAHILHLWFIRISRLLSVFVRIPLVSRAAARDVIHLRASHVRAYIRT